MVENLNTPGAAPMAGSWRVPSRLTLT